MEFDEIVVKESPGLCRCCLSEGCYKDLGSEYIWMNETEVYADMLLECFDISITQHNEGPNGPNRLICEVCITRLRDACNFKKQVLDSEKKFIDMMGRGEFRPKMVIYQAQMKCEESAAEPPPEETEVEYLDDDMDFVDDTEEPIKDETEPTVSDITVSSLPIKGKRGRPRKNLVKPEKKAKIAKLEEKPKTSKAVAKDVTASYNSDSNVLNRSDNKIDAQTNNDTFKSQLIAILQKSTAMPFRRHESQYKCFFCDCLFSLPSALKKHNSVKHQRTDPNEYLKISKDISLRSNLMLDINDWRCALCDTELTDKTKFKMHFVQAHNEDIPKDVLNNIVCFKLLDNALMCFLCNEQFYYFGNLIHHMKSHINVGSPPSTVQFRPKRIFKPRKTQRTGLAPCPFCRLAFSSKKEKVEHLAQFHRKNFQCDICSEQFRYKSSLTNHIKNIHLKLQNGTCEVCGKSFFSTYYLKLHRISHTNIKLFECDICKKRFHKKEIMKLHRRIHTDDKRYVCDICGRKFIQWTSLHGHRVVHSDKRPFSCPVCNKTFKQRSGLRKHSRNVHQQKTILSK